MSNQNTTMIRVDKGLLKELKTLRPELTDLKAVKLVSLILREAILRKKEEA